MEFSKHVMVTYFSLLAAIIICQRNWTFIKGLKSESFSTELRLPWNQRLWVKSKPGSCQTDWIFKIIIILRFLMGVKCSEVTGSGLFTDAQSKQIPWARKVNSRSNIWLVRQTGSRVGRLWWMLRIGLKSWARRSWLRLLMFTHQFFTYDHKQIDW